jgi:hypothetical protein
MINLDWMERIHIDYFAISGGIFGTSIAESRKNRLKKRGLTLLSK